MEALRTPDDRFTGLPGHPFAPHYVEAGGLRIHYVDEGPRNAAPVLLLHGEPSWSYLYRKMIPLITAAGHRAIAPDLVGFGRSDKPVRREDYTYQRHVEWMRGMLEQLELRNVTLVGQDWGGLIGLRLAAEHPERFARIVAANTFLPTGDRPAGPAFLAWRKYSQETPDFHVRGTVKGGCVTDLPRPSGRQLRRRALRTFRVAGRNFRRLAGRRLLRRSIAEHAYARPLRLTFEELGATYVKFGQLIASSPGLFGDEASNEFRSCLDTGPAVPFAEVRAAVETTLGGPLESAFASFDEIPIGRASIAVVHRATLRDGRTAAVKVLRPGIEDVVATDLRLMEPLLDFLSRQVGVAEAGQLVRMMDGFRQQVAEELDLRNEARAMAHYRDLLRRVDLPLVVVPEPYPALSGPRVLAMEFLDGVPIDDLAGIAELGVDPAPQAGQGGAWPARLGRLREQRRLHRGVAEHGAIGSDFDRGTFLLGKQLMYFERYGKMFLSDVSLLSDRKFFEGLLAESA